MCLAIMCFMEEQGGISGMQVQYLNVKEVLKKKYDIRRKPPFTLLIYIPGGHFKRRKSNNRVLVRCIMGNI